VCVKSTEVASVFLSAFIAMIQLSCTIRHCFSSSFCPWRRFQSTFRSSLWRFEVVTSRTTPWQSWSRLWPYPTSSMA